MLTSLQPWKRAKVTFISFILLLLLLLLLNPCSALIAADGTFEYKKFFATCGLAGKSGEELKKAFDIIDQDRSGFIEEEELK